MRELQKRYHRGRVPFTACQADPRFSYCLYVPDRHLNQVWQEAPLVVVVHGSSRTAEGFRDAFIEFAEAQGCVVLAPLFPRGAVAGDQPDGYKLQSLCGYRYDQILLSMVAEVAGQFRTERDFYLYGFSGGAQFAHRFAYFHPGRLKGVAIHAPGQVSLPGSLNSALDLAALKQVSIQMVIGGEDTDPVAAIEEHPPGGSRKDLLLRLHQSWRRLGIAAELEEMPGVAHDGFALMPACQAFFAHLLRRFD